MTSESWRPVAEFPGRYEASDLGRVRSVGFYSGNRWGTRTWRAGRVLTPSVHDTGHLYVVLTDGAGGQVARSVHRLVLTAFTGGPPEGRPNALHKNDIPADNRLENLYWGTHSENNYDSVANGNHVQARKRTCGLNHLLVEPNLVPSTTEAGGRGCLACKQAQSSHYGDARRRRQGKLHTRGPYKGRDGFQRRAGESFENEAHRRYRHIMESAGSVVSPHPHNVEVGALVGRSPEVI